MSNGLVADSSKFIFHAESTDKVVFFASNGRFFTIQADKLPSGRGFGSPLRLMIDLPNEEEIISVFSGEDLLKVKKLLMNHVS